MAGALWSDTHAARPGEPHGFDDIVGALGDHDGRGALVGDPVPCDPSFVVAVVVGEEDVAADEESGAAVRPDGRGRRQRRGRQAPRPRTTGA